MLYFVERNQQQDPNFVKNNLEDICAGLQHTIVSYLMEKLKNAVDQTGIKEVAIGGGVSANSGIRAALADAERQFGWRVHIPKFEYCTDNAAMIAIVGALKHQQKAYASTDVVAQARLKI